MSVAHQLKPTNALTSVAGLITLVSGLSLFERATADVTLPSIFSNHMVLQQDVAVPVWGRAEPGEEVKVSIAGKTAAAKADGSGKWMVTLDHPTATGPVTMTVQGKNTISIDDVLIGEVWLGAGQSNMQMNVGSANNARHEINSAKSPQIRMFTVERKTAVEPQEDCGGKWVVCSPETAIHFSATAYFFGRELHQTLNVPVGLINASWGGTTIEAWTSMDAQKDEPELAPIFENWKQKVSQPYDEKMAMARYEKQMVFWGNQAEKAKAAGKQPPQKPKTPIAPRLEPNHPANLFNGMIAPVIHYAIRGAIWYQGESNSMNNGPHLYETQLPMLVKDWRQRWNQGDFPFLWVQLPNFKKRNDDPGAVSNWASMREVFLKQLLIPNTGMAICIDVGDEGNIHPKNKQTVGRRLALWARARVYHEEIPYSGPLPAGHEINGGEVTISFTHTDGGLKAKGGELKGFAIAGNDKKWIWASARIDGDKVIVSSPEVAGPAAVRYAWGDNPECNLINHAGLPASPFRTDDW